MEFIIDRRAVLATGAALAVSHMLPVRAQDKPTLRFAAVFSEKDIRADMIRMVSKDVEADVKIEPFYGATLFKQGTELVALQRDNLEMGNVAPQDISKQVAAWSVRVRRWTRSRSTSRTSRPAQRAAGGTQLLPKQQGDKERRQPGDQPRCLIEEG